MFYQRGSPSFAFLTAAHCAFRVNGLHADNPNLAEHGAPILVQQAMLQQQACDVYHAFGLELRSIFATSSQSASAKSLRAKFLTAHPGDECAIARRVSEFCPQFKAANELQQPFLITMETIEELRDFRLATPCQRAKAEQQRRRDNVVRANFESERKQRQLWFDFRGYVLPKQAINSLPRALDALYKRLLKVKQHLEKFQHHPTIAEVLAKLYPSSYEINTDAWQPRQGISFSLDQLECITNHIDIAETVYSVLQNRLFSHHLDSSAHDVLALDWMRGDFEDVAEHEKRADIEDLLWHQKFARMNPHLYENDRLGRQGSMGKEWYDKMKSATPYKRPAATFWYARRQHRRNRIPNPDLAQKVTMPLAEVPTHVSFWTTWQPRARSWEELKKNLVNKIFGYLARCEFWAKLGLRFWILVG